MACDQEAMSGTLSDAMIWQKPTIATGYSGNLEFMNAENSFLVDFTENYIKPEDCFHLFREDMKWAYPSEVDLERKLLFLYNNRDTSVVRAKIHNASKDTNKFCRSAVERIIQHQIVNIADSECFSQLSLRS